MLSNQSAHASDWHASAQRRRGPGVSSLPVDKYPGYQQAAREKAES